MKKAFSVNLDWLLSGIEGWLLLDILGGGATTTFRGNQGNDKCKWESWNSVRKYLIEKKWQKIGRLCDGANLQEKDVMNFGAYRSKVVRTWNEDH